MSRLGAAARHDSESAVAPHPGRFYVRVLLPLCVIAGCVAAAGCSGSYDNVARPAELPSVAEPPPVELGEEYAEYSRNSSIPAEYEQPTLLHRTLWYLPNRILDFLDIIRADVGVGPAWGAVVRVTRWGQVGIRTFEPMSLRAGLRGRELPLFIEHSNEMGVGPFFVGSDDRSVTPLEVGAGAEVLLVGAYLGVSVDEAVDFVLGIFGIDTARDDL